MSKVGSFIVSTRCPELPQQKAMNEPILVPLNYFLWSISFTPIRQSAVLHDGSAGF